MHSTLGFEESMPTANGYAPDGPDPITLEEVREELDYWRRRLARERTSPLETAVAIRMGARIARLKDLEETYEEERKGHPAERVMAWIHRHPAWAGVILVAAVSTTLGVSYSGLKDSWQWLQAVIGHLQGINFF
jgi:hypothetical protein